MKPEIKKLWVEALKSGEFKQDTGGLRTDKGYCCLGVLCELHRQSVTPTADGWKGGKWLRYDGEVLYLPPSVMEWAGIKDSNPIINPDPDSNYKNAASYNDNGATFKTIAKLIKKNL